MVQGMRFSLFVSLWIVLLAYRSSCLREGASQRMGDPMTEMEEEVEKLIQELAFAPRSRVYDGSSSSGSSVTPETLPRPLTMSTPSILPTPPPLPRPLPMPTHPILPSPRPLPRHPPMPTFPIPIHVFSPQPSPLVYFIPAPGYLLAHVPGRGLLPVHSFMTPPARLVARAPWPLPFQLFVVAPVHILAFVPGPEGWLLLVPMPESGRQ